MPDHSHQPNPRPRLHDYAADAEHSAATILYSLVREAGSPYTPPHGTVLQLHVDKTTWHAARNWFIDINTSPFPPPASPDPADPDQTINAAALDFLAETLHDAYEQAATLNGWPTNPDAQTTWSKLPTANQNTMRAAITAMLSQLGIQVAQPGTPQPVTPASISGIIPP